MCLPVLKESNKSRFDRCSRQKHCIDHIPYCLSGLLRAHFSDNLSRNSCIRLHLLWVNSYANEQKCNVTMNPPIKRAPQLPYEKGKIWVFNS